MDRIIVIGAGGHARSVLDILLENNEYEVLGCLDPIFPINKFVPKMPEVAVIGIDGDMKKFYDDGINKIFVAIGDNKLRKKLQDQAIAIGFEVINAVSKFSRISSRASLGKGICIMAGAIVNVNCRIGDGCIINTNCSIDHDCEIADFVHVAPGTAISGTTSVGQGTHIGTNSSEIDGTVIGEWSYIGAGAAVVKNIGSHVMAYGVPAREIRSLKE